MKHDVIKKSHLRSLEKGIAKDLLFPQKMLYGNDLQALFHRKSLLINTSTPFMRNLRQLVEGSGFVIILTDEQGCILQIDGDSDILHNARLFDMVLGAYMAEDSVGTNAMILQLRKIARFNLLPKNILLMLTIAGPVLLLRYMPRMALLLAP